MPWGGHSFSKLFTPRKLRNLNLTPRIYVTDKLMGKVETRGSWDSLPGQPAW